MEIPKLVIAVSRCSGSINIGKCRSKLLVSIEVWILNRKVMQESGIVLVLLGRKRELMIKVALNSADVLPLASWLRK